MGVGIGIDAVGEGDSLVGRSPLDDRLMVRSEFYNLGIVMGCVVATSVTGMTYTVSPGSDPVSVAVGSRSGADGATKFVVPSGTVTTAAAPSSGARFDVVWARQNDPEKGDPDNMAVLGLTQGAATASPTVPAVPAGAVVLAIYQVAQGAVSTSGATLVQTGNQAIPYGARLGTLHRYVDTTNGKPAQALRTLGSKTIKLPTPRQLEFRLQPTISSEQSGKSGSVLIRFVMDGVVIASNELDFNSYYRTQYTAYSVNASAGEHQVSYQIKHQYGDPYVLRYGAINGEKFPGTLFQVIDDGITA